MQRSLTSLALILALGLGAGRATALGLGKAAGATTLGQPLSFAVALHLEASENIEAACIKAEVSSGDRVLPASLVRVRLETVAGSGERRIAVGTTIAIDEPLVSIELHVGCPPSLSRSFLVFADPPPRNAASVNPLGASPLMPGRSGSPLAAVLAAAESEAAASAPAAKPVLRTRKRRAVPGSEGEPGRAGEAMSPRLAVPAASVPRTRAVPAPPRPRGPVLRLDPVEADALISPSLQMTTTLAQPPDPAAAAASGPPRFLDPEQAQRWHEQERLKAMEAALFKLRTDSQATRKALADTQLRVRAAEAGRYANPLVYLLMALCALLGAGVLGLWWLRQRERQAAAWWTPPAEANAPAGPDAVLSEPPLPPLEPVPPALPPVASMFNRPASSKPAVRPAELDSTVIEPRRPMSAEELIDLEQQAEFFVVLGQDDAAIDLLMGHVRSTGGVSPLPYMKLLEIYRRRGEREPYDRIRERFNRRFNAYAPEWEVDPEQGLSLEGYPEVMGRLQKVWGTPSRAMELLDAALFRRDAGPTFDVPAYRELLFLYSMARDLAERDLSRDGVDLLLPLNEDDPSPMSSAVPATPASLPEELGQEHFSLDLDVSSDRPPLLSLDDPDFKRDPR